MSGGLVFATAGALLFALGAAGMIAQGHLLRRIMGFNLLGSGAFLVMVGLAQRDGLPDPVPQAMVLTGIVVSVAATAVALALVRALQRHGRRYRLPPVGEDD